MAASAAAGAVTAEQLKDIVGLDDKNATDLATKSQDRAADLVAYFTQHKVGSDAARPVKVMLYTAWTKAAPANRDYIAARILDGALKSTQQVDAAIRFLGKDAPKAGDAEWTAKFDKECGVGASVSTEQAQKLVAEFLSKQEPKSVKASWVKAGSGPFLGQLKKIDALRWADFTVVKDIVEAEVPKIVATVPDEEAPAAGAGAAAAAASEEPKAKKAEVVFAPSESYEPFMQKQRTWLKDLDTVPAGTSVTVLCWAHSVRHQKGLSFVVVRDTTGFCQVVFEGKVPEFARESSLALTGVVKDEPKVAVVVDGEEKGRPWAIKMPPKEIKVTEYAIVGAADPEIENIITKQSGVDLRYDQRHIVIREKNDANKLKIRSFAVQAFRNHFFERRLVEVQPPTLVNAQAEGGSQVFNVKYYGEDAYLTQSSQLYLETCLSSIGDVFCIVSSYRAENQKTNRHLAEYTHIEGEYAFITYEDLLSRLEDLVCDVFDQTIRVCGDLVASLNPGGLKEGATDVRDPASWKLRPSKPFVRLPYHKAIDKCNELGILNTTPEDQEEPRPFRYGDDITDFPERQLVGHFGVPVMMTHFPATMKAFYMSKDKKDATLTESVDVLVPGVGEIIGGSMRMWNYDELMAAYKANNLDPAPYYWYTDQRRFGTMPHGGFGLGLERFLRWICNLDTIREACLFPRYMGRCAP
jgi:asparaginyl-tRNA synthetase